MGGGGWGFGYYLPQGWVSSPAASPALCMVRGAAPAWGGYSPSPWQGPVVPGQAMGWEPMEDVSSGSLLEAPGSSLGSSPGSSPDSRAVDLQCQGEHCAMGQRGTGCPVWWAAGIPGSKADWQPCPLSASVAISPAKPAVTPAHGLSH